MVICSRTQGRTALRSIEPRARPLPTQINVTDVLTKAAAREVGTHTDKKFNFERAGARELVQTNEPNASLSGGRSNNAEPGRTAVNQYW